MKTVQKIFLFIAFLFFIEPAFSKDYSKKIYLWRGIPEMETQVRDTVLYYCPADRDGALAPATADNLAAANTGAPTPAAADALTPAVIICPGGSYHHLGMKHEGFSSARWFNSIGIKAFVLQYRVAYNEHHYPDQLQDIQMAIHYVRRNAQTYRVDPNKVGVIGYSAGGHLVTMAGAFSKRDTLSALGVSVTESLRPDFVIPVYPVVSMQDDIAHRWSRKSLLGHQWNRPNAVKGWSIFNLWGHAYSQEFKDAFSMEKQIPSDMPPVFLLACRDDPVVMYENSVRLDKALTEKAVNHIFVSYDKGGHGFGMKENSSIMLNEHWNQKNLLPWLIQIGVVER